MIHLFVFILLTRYILSYYTLSSIVTLHVKIDNQIKQIANINDIKSLCSTIVESNDCINNIHIKLIELQNNADSEYSKCNPIQHSLGWCLIQPVNFGESIIPIVYKPTDSLQRMLQSWKSRMNASAINSLQQEMQFKTSSTLEQLLILLPATIIGCLISSRQTTLTTQPLISNSQIESIASIRFLLIITVVLGHSYQLCQGVKDPFDPIGIELSYVACIVLFFMSGMGTAAETFTIDSFYARISRLWICCGILLIAAAGFGIQQFNSSVIIKLMVSNFIDWTPTPVDAIISTFAPSLWTIPYTIQCWFVILALEVYQKKSCLAIITILSSLFAMKASYYLVSFFSGALLVIAARDLKVNIYKLPMLAATVAFTPWSIVYANPSTVAAASFTFFIAIFCFTLYSVQKIKLMKDHTCRRFGYKMNKTYAIAIFCGSSTIQLNLIRLQIATTPVLNCFVTICCCIFFVLAWNFVWKHLQNLGSSNNHYFTKKSNQITLLLLLLAFGCVQGHEMAAEVEFAWPKMNMNFSQSSEISTLIAIHQSRSEQLLENLRTEQLTEFHQVCQLNKKNPIVCSEWFSPKRNNNDTVKITLEQVGSIDLILHVKFCNQKSDTSKCATISSSPLSINVKPCHENQNGILATIEAASNSLRTKEFQIFRPKFSRAILSSTDSEFQIIITSPRNATVFILHQARIDFTLIGKNAPRLDPHTKVCVDLRFNIYSKVTATICTPLVYFEDQKGSVIINFSGLNGVQNGVMYLWLCINNICSDVAAAIFANDQTYDPKYSPNIVTWSQLQSRKRKRLSNQVQSTASQSLPCVFMSFAWSIEYLRSALVLGKSLKKVQSQYNLVIVVPISLINEYQVTLSEIATIHEHVHRVVLVPDTDTNHSAYHLYRKFGSKMYLKLLSFNFIEYDKIVVIDADSFVLNAQVDLLFDTKFKDVSGVGDGIMPGSLFIVKPSIELMKNTLARLKKHDQYRLREMGYLNAAFAAGSINNLDNERLPFTASCTPMNKELYSDCITMDLSFCSQKPWNIVESDTELLHCARTDLTDRNLDLTWTRAVRDWHTISKSVGDASPRSAIDSEIKITEKSSLCIKKMNTNELNKEIIFNIQLCAVRNVCIRTEQAMHCKIYQKGDHRIIVPKTTTTTHGDHRIILYCMTTEQLQSLRSSASHEELRQVSLSCGKIEYSYNSIPNSLLDFEQAQRYVSGGSLDLAMKKWQHSGKGQLEILRSAGLQSQHSILEFGCGTLNLARFLLNIIRPNEYHCVEPNLFLIQSSLVENKPNNIHVRKDFCADKKISKQFDFVVAHSVLSHAGIKQWNYFFKSLTHHLSINGVALVSGCFCTPCENLPRQYEKNSKDTCGDSFDDEWVYPYVTWWKESTIVDLGHRYGLHVIRRPDLREIMLSFSTADNHDWMSVTKIEEM